MEYFLHIFIMIVIYVALSVSFNILFGYTGVLALCHAAFYGIGAYSFALLSMHAGFGFLPALFCAALITALISLVIAVPGLRVHWDYMIIFAFAFQMAIYHIMINWRGLTRGPQGIPGIPQPEIFGYSFDSPISFLFLALFMTSGIIYLVKRLEKSTFGLVLKGIKDDEIAVKSIGKNITVYKVISFAIAAGMAAVAGTMSASYLSYISPTNFDLHMSIFVLICLIFGGLGRISGAILGTVILTALPESLRFIPMLPSTMLGGIRDFIYATILLVFILYRPQGLLGKAGK